MTVLAKRKPKLHLLAAAMGVPVSEVHAQVATVDQVVLVCEAVIAWVTVARVAKAAISVKIAVLVWAMLPSVRSVKPWNAPKCRFANWPHKPTAKR